MGELEPKSEGKIGPSLNKWGEAEQIQFLLGCVSLSFCFVASNTERHPTGQTAQAVSQLLQRSAKVGASGLVN